MVKRERKITPMGLPQYDGFVFHIDPDGNVIRGPLGVRSAQYEAEAVIHTRSAVEIEAGYHYYVDDNGDIVASPMSNFGKEDQRHTEKELAAWAYGDRVLTRLFEDHDGLDSEIMNYLWAKYGDGYPPKDVSGTELESEIRELHARFRKEKGGPGS